jgi:hypothetical protein
LYTCCLAQVEFEKAVDAKGNIEVWLQRLVDSMQDTIKQGIKRAVRNVYEMGLEDFIFGHPAQVCLLDSSQRPKAELSACWLPVNGQELS